jgi:hypothetical protein
MGPLKQLALLAIFATSVYAERRDGKSIGIFNIVKFDNDVCNAAAQNMNGTCYTAEECAERDGTASGSCADGYGVCCIIEVSCGGRTSENCTYLTQTPSASPAVDSDDLDDQCSYTFCPRTSSVNRIRLEFATFMLAPPVAPTAIDGTAGNGNPNVVNNQDFAIGQCNTDSFSVGNSPVICGVNDGQHMVVDTDGTDCVTALFTFGGGTVMRGYTIHVLQFDITNEMGGPPGCLQFFTGEMGTVSTFNWQAPATSTHLANQNYDVCVRKLIDRCAICWSTVTTGNGENGQAAGNGVPQQGTLGSFGINNGEVSADGQGKSGAGVANCASRTAKQLSSAPAKGDSDDFIIIPLGIAPGAANANLDQLNANTVPTATLGESLFCGRYLNADAAGKNFDGTVCSRVTPFTLGVRFDNREATGSTALLNGVAAADAVAAAGGEQTKQEASSQTAAGAPTEPLGTIGFSLGFAQIAC